MNDTLHYRAMAEDDGPRLSELSRRCPDTGLVRAFARYGIDAYRALLALRPDTYGVLAEAPDDGELAGSAFVSFRPCRVDGQTLSSALFHTLMVHPRHRNKGLASALTRRAVEHARARLGPEGFIFAHIQNSNVASFKAIGKWIPRCGGELEGHAVRTRRSPPRLARGFRVRPAASADLPRVASALDAFYARCDLTPPFSAASLEARLAQTPFDTPFRHAWVITSERGELLAGVTIVEQSRIRTLEIEWIPPLMRLANRLLRVLPESGVLRQLTVEDAWFADGQARAARALWEALRWEYRDRGDALICFFDPKSPLRAMFGVPAWTSKTSTTLLYDAPAPMGGDRLLYPLV